MVSNNKKYLDFIDDKELIKNYLKKREVPKPLLEMIEEGYSKEFICYEIDVRTSNKSYIART